jgi:hypothetical protein
MTKEQLIEQLEGVKTLSPVVSIDSVVALLKNQLEEPGDSRALFNKIRTELADQITQSIYDCCDVVDLDSARFDLGYDGRTIELNEVDLDFRVIESVVDDCIDSFITDEMEKLEEENTEVTNEPLTPVTEE